MALKMTTFRSDMNRARGERNGRATQPDSVVRRAWKLRDFGYGPQLIAAHLRDEGIEVSHMVIGKWIYGGVRAHA